MCHLLTFSKSLAFLGYHNLYKATIFFNSDPEKWIHHHIFHLLLQWPLRQLYFALNFISYMYTPHPSQNFSSVSILSPLVFSPNSQCYLHPSPSRLSVSVSISVFFVCLRLLSPFTLLLAFPLSLAVSVLYTSSSMSQDRVLHVCVYFQKQFTLMIIQVYTVIFL